MSVKDLPVDYRRSPSPGQSFPSPTGIVSQKHLCHLTDTPVRKNKRKRSEPKKRSDFSIKRFCPESPGSACSESGRSEDTDVNVDESPRVPSVCSNNVLLPEHTDTRGENHSDSNSNSSPPAHPGLVMFPGHFPPGFMIPNFHYKHPGLPFPVPQPLPPGQLQRVDLIQSAASGYRTGGISSTNGNNNVKQTTINNSNKDTKSISVENESDDFNESSSRGGRKNRKNYKNMTRERRIEANARERTRVHTISAAFESLRRAVPSYSYNQKLSKLAILRIASSYIMALGRLAEIDNLDNSEERSSFANCVDLCTRTIQTEGRARRRH